MPGVLSLGVLATQTKDSGESAVAAIMELEMPGRVMAIAVSVPLLQRRHKRMHFAQIQEGLLIDQFNLIEHHELTFVTDGC